jgi:membrane-associated phospholipid phosphatase
MGAQAGPWRGHRGKRWQSPSRSSASPRDAPAEPAEAPSHASVSSKPAKPEPEPEPEPEPRPDPRPRQNPIMESDPHPSRAPLWNERFAERVLLVTGFVYVLLLFDVWYGGLVVRLDGPLAQAVAWAPDTLRAVVGMLFSVVGDTWLLALVVIATAVRAWSRGSVRTAGLVAASALTFFFFIQFSKWAVGRPRPETFFAGRSWMPDWLYSTSMAFPSGHSAAPVLVYGLALLVFFGPRPHREDLLPVPSRLPSKALWGAAALAFLPGIGRLVWGVHWTTDVLGGWLLGIAWLTATLLTAQALSEYEKNASKPLIAEADDDFGSAGWRKKEDPAEPSQSPGPRAEAFQGDPPGEGASGSQNLQWRRV